MHCVLDTSVLLTAQGTMGAALWSDIPSTTCLLPSSEVGHLVV